MSDDLNRQKDFAKSVTLFNSLKPIADRYSEKVEDEAQQQSDRLLRKLKNGENCSIGLASLINSGATSMEGGVLLPTGGIAKLKGIVYYSCFTLATWDEQVIGEFVDHVTSFKPSSRDVETKITMKINQYGPQSTQKAFNEAKAKDMDFTVENDKELAKMWHKFIDDHEGDIDDGYLFDCLRKTVKLLRPDIDLTIQK